MDPINVVSGAMFDYAFRAAAYNIVKQMEDEAAEKAKQAQQAKK